MHIHEPHNRVDVTTPKGDGVIWLVTEYGHETDTLYTIILNDGRIWQYTHKDIVVKDNVSFNRKSNSAPTSIGKGGDKYESGFVVCKQFMGDGLHTNPDCMKCGLKECEHPVNIQSQNVYD